jgi:hypothetical protein
MTKHIDVLLSALRAKLEDKHIPLTPETRVADLPLDSLTWLDLLFEFESITGRPPPTMGMLATLGDISKELGLEWEVA